MNLRDSEKSSGQLAAEVSAAAIAYETAVARHEYAKRDLESRLEQRAEAFERLRDARLALDEYLPTEDTP